MKLLSYPRHSTVFKIEINTPASVTGGIACTSQTASLLFFDSNLTIIFINHSLLSHFIEVIVYVITNYKNHLAENDWGGPTVTEFRGPHGIEEGKGERYLASGRQYGNALLGVRHQEQEITNLLPSLLYRASTSLGYKSKICELKVTLKTIKLNNKNGKLSVLSFDTICSH